MTGTPEGRRKPRACPLCPSQHRS